MRVWIDKENEMHPNAEWNDSYVFTLTRKKYSTIFSGITDDKFTRCIFKL